MTVWEELVEAYKSVNIEFSHLKPITLAQWMLESGRGKSDLAQKHLNFGGLKYRSEMKDIAEPVEYEAHDGKDNYCKFNSVQDFVKGYWIFIDRWPYDGWRDNCQTGIEYIEFIGPRYTPSPSYSNKVIELLSEAEKLITLDEEDEPDRPSISESGVFLIEPPVIKYIDNIKHKIRGKRPNGLEGLIVHFDAFRIKPESKIEDRAIQTLHMGKANGYNYGAISRSGNIYIPGNVDWLSWGYHAGKSRCPLTNRSGVSQYYIGMEINNPGIVYEDEVEGVFFPWFNTKVDIEGHPILRNGKRQIRSLADEHYRRSEVRYCKKKDNISEAWYVPYTKAQFNALVSLIKYLKDLYPNSFSIDKVFGHDEVSPRRKTDPGGTMAHEDELMTMPEFRTHLKQIIG